MSDPIEPDTRNAVKRIREPATLGMPDYYDNTIQSHIDIVFHLDCGVCPASFEVRQDEGEDFGDWVYRVADIAMAEGWGWLNDRTLCPEHALDTESNRMLIAETKRAEEEIFRRTDQPRSRMRWWRQLLGLR